MSQYMERLQSLQETSERLTRQLVEIKKEAEAVKEEMIREHLAEYQAREGNAGVIRYWLEWGREGGGPELCDASHEIRNLGESGADALNREMHAWARTLHPPNLVWENSDYPLEGRVWMNLRLAADDAAGAAGGVAHVLDALADETRPARMDGNPFPGFAFRVVPSLPHPPLALLRSTASGWELVTMDKISLGAVEGSCLPLIERAREISIARTAPKCGMA
ncbi:hypothetical protein ACWD4O_38895 [Streptomyces sp. NPDC002623]